MDNNKKTIKLLESLPPYIRRRLPTHTMMDELNNIIDYELNPLSFKDPIDYVSEICDFLTEQIVNDAWETKKLKITSKEKDQIYHYVIDTFFDYILKKFHDSHKKHENKKIQMKESKKKYLVTESQYNLMMEQSVPLWFKRRYNSEYMKDLIDEAILNHPTPCIEFDDEYEYADEINREAVDNFLSVNEDIFEDERYDEYEERLTTLCRDEFGEMLFESYRITCE